MLQRTKFPTDLIALLQQHGDGDVPFPLEALKEGRFPRLAPFSASAFRNCRMPAEAYAGFLLYAGFGTKSHSASQDLKSREGSYWHGIYHRMEPDDWNAKYWFRQVGAHEVGPSLAEKARTAGWETGSSWDHSRFVEFASEARASRDIKKVEIAQQIQLLEWQLLFEFCAKEISE